MATAVSSYSIRSAIPHQVKNNDVLEKLIFRHLKLVGSGIFGSGVPIGDRSVGGSGVGQRGWVFLKFLLEFSMFWKFDFWSFGCSWWPPRLPARTSPYAKYTWASSCRAKKKNKKY